MIIRAAAALPDDDRERATETLRERLRVMADATGATPAWATLDVTGPTEMAGADELARFEWTASVAVEQPGPERPADGFVAPGLGGQES